MTDSAPAVIGQQSVPPDNGRRAITFSVPFVTEPWEPGRSSPRISMPIAVTELRSARPELRILSLKHFVAYQVANIAPPVTAP